MPNTPSTPMAPGAGSVYQKSARTGQAYVINPDLVFRPLEEAKQYKANMGAAQEQARQAQEKADNAAKKEIADLLTLPTEEVFYNDVTWQQKELNATQKFIAEKIRANGGVPQPGSEDWLQIQELTNGLRAGQITSKQNREYHKAATTEYNQDPGKYDPQFLFDLTEWTQRPIRERGEPPLLDYYFDQPSAMQKEADILSELDAMGGTYTTPDGRTIEWEDEEVSPFRIAARAQANTQDPKWARVLGEEMSTMSPEQKAELGEYTRSVNAKNMASAKKHGEQYRPMSLSEGLMYRKIESVAPKRHTEQSTAQSEAGIGYRQDKASADYLLSRLKGWSTGQWEGFQPDPNNDRYLVDQDFQPYRYGPAGALQVGQIRYDKEKGRAEYMLEVNPAIAEDGEPAKVTEEEKEKLNKWVPFDEDTAFGILGEGIIEGSPEYNRGAILKFAEEKYGITPEDGKLSTKKIPGKDQRQFKKGVIPEANWPGYEVPKNPELINADQKTYTEQEGNLTPAEKLRRAQAQKK